jgi:hypothetical protein
MNLLAQPDALLWSKPWCPNRRSNSASSVYSISEVIADCSTSSVVHRYCLLVCSARRSRALLGTLAERSIGQLPWKSRSVFEPLANRCILKRSISTHKSKQPECKRCDRQERESRPHQPNCGTDQEASNFYKEKSGPSGRHSVDSKPQLTISISPLCGHYPTTSITPCVFPELMGLRRRPGAFRDGCGVFPGERPQRCIDRSTCRRCRCHCCLQSVRRNVARSRPIEEISRTRPESSALDVPRPQRKRNEFVPIFGVDRIRMVMGR